jgi:hypothetical protein
LRWRILRNLILRRLRRKGALLDSLELCGALRRFLLSPLACFELRLAMRFGGGTLHLGALQGFGFLALALALSFDGFLYPLPCLFASLCARRREVPVFRAVQIRPRI